MYCIYMYNSFVALSFCSTTAMKGREKPSSPTTANATAQKESSALLLYLLVL